MPRKKAVPAWIACGIDEAEARRERGGGEADRQHLHRVGRPDQAEDGEQAMLERADADPAERLVDGHRAHCASSDAVISATATSSSGASPSPRSHAAERPA